MRAFLLRPLAALARAGVRLIDRILRWQLGVFEFSSDPRCYLRAARLRCPRDLVLSDGAHLRIGDPLLALHLWNERLAGAAQASAPLGWGMVLARGSAFSLQELARFLTLHREFDNVRGLYGEMGFIDQARIEQARRIAGKLGFDLIEREQPGWNVFQRAFWENVFSWWMMWAFNAGSRADKSFAQLRRCELWMSRARLIERYGGQAATPSSIHSP